MKLQPLGNSAIRISALVLGTSQFGAAIDEATARTLVDSYLAAGGNSFDTADAYGESERFLGRLLKGRRRQVILASKVGGTVRPGVQGLSRAHIFASIDESLQRLQTDYLDLYQTHHWDPDTPIGETIDALERCVQAGKVRAYGLSNLTGWQIGLMAGAGARPIALQTEYSLLQRTAEIERIPACDQLGIGVLAWSPLAGGILTGKYPAGGPPPEGSRGWFRRTGPHARSWSTKLTARNLAIVDLVRSAAAELGATPSRIALRWLIDRPIVGAIIGPRTPDQLRDNLGAVDLKLPESLIARLNEASRIDLGAPYVSPRVLT